MMYRSHGIKPQLSGYTLFLAVEYLLFIASEHLMSDTEYTVSMQKRDQFLLSVSLDHMGVRLKSAFLSSPQA